MLGPLGGKRVVWAECLFADPIGDIAVLEQPGNQSLYDEAEAYDRLLAGMKPLAIGDAPAQRRERVLVPGGSYRLEGELKEAPPLYVEQDVPGEAPVRLLSLKGGRWIEGRALRRGMWLALEPNGIIASGISGSPLLSM